MTSPIESTASMTDEELLQARIDLAVEYINECLEVNARLLGALEAGNRLAKTQDQHTGSTGMINIANSSQTMLRGVRQLLIGRRAG